MTSIATLPAASVSSPYQPWYRRFLENRDASPSLPWHDSYLLSAGERAIVARSIQQFQLGEWARGHGLMRRASSHPAFSSDLCFLPSQELFIEEEQRHSRMLGCFLDREGIPRLANNWVDGTFRCLRKLAGLEVCVTVLVTAEILAVPFYQALRDSTRSPLLRSICERILRDEAAHLNYQALTLSVLRRPLGNKTRAIRLLCHSLLFYGTAFLVWRQHRKVFRAAKWDFRLYWREARRGFAQLHRQVARVLVP